ncbi:hypothetical protein ACFQ9Y_14750 [Peribacillus simplex]|uniref:hypothetical protein n=1 Tax=Peribacillus simplex TaxID=1478 RepID=UPI00366A74BA
MNSAVLLVSFGVLLVSSTFTREFTPFTRKWALLMSLVLLQNINPSGQNGFVLLL